MQKDEENRKNNKKSFRILSIDGGGLKGIFAAHLLKRIEEEYNIKWLESFQLITGTSTGSIIAAGLASGLTAEDILKLYKKHGELIFKKKHPLKFGIFSSKYNNNYLKNILKEIFGNKMMSDINIPLIIPATNIGTGSVIVFKSQYHKEFYRDKSIYLRDVVLASCSAPTYFDPYRIKEYLLADGGLWANNPALIAIIDAKYRLRQNLKDLKILSLGSKSISFYKQKRQSFWGFLTGWKRSKFIDMIFNLQTLASSNMVKLLLEKKQILRLTLDQEFSLDKPSQIENIVSYADELFTYNANNIKKFIT
jgi:patatin-like phospholipase/acyl hydrolase